MAKMTFKRIRERAAKRKGGEKVLTSLLPKKPNNKALARLPDDRVLSEMAARVFSAGFVWSVIDQKWPGFEEAFLEFNPKRPLFQPAEFWEKLASDKRIVRNPQKIMAVRDNACFVADIAREHGSFGKFLAQWPVSDQVGLLDLLGKRGARHQSAHPAVDQPVTRLAGVESLVGRERASERLADLTRSEDPDLRLRHGSGVEHGAG